MLTDLQRHTVYINLINRLSRGTVGDLKEVRILLIEEGRKVHKEALSQHPNYYIKRDMLRVQFPEAAMSGLLDMDHPAIDRRCKGVKNCHIIAALKKITMNIQQPSEKYPLRKELPLNNKYSIMVWHNSDFTQVLYHLVHITKNSPFEQLREFEAIAAFSKLPDFTNYMSRADLTDTTL